MLRWRLIFGTLIIALLSALCWADSHAVRAGIWLVPLALVLCVLATQEMLCLFRAAGRQPIAWAAYVGTVLPVLGACAPIVWVEYPADCPIGKLGWLAGGLVLGLLVAIVAEMGRYGQPGQTITNLAPVALTILYVGGLLGFLVQVRLLYDNKEGLVALVSLIATVKLSDTGQYLFGTFFGKRKLAPALSPGKTWEGTVYGLAFAVIVGSFFLWSWITKSGTGQGVLGVVLYCILVGAAGILGDLAESMLKRDAGVKDSSRWLLGLGGVLDLLDSLLFAAPVAYFCWVSGLLRP